MSLLYCALLRGNTEWRVRRPVAGSRSPLDDLEEEAFAVGPAVELEILAVLVAVIEDVQGCSRALRSGVEAEAGFEVIVVIPRDRQRCKARAASMLLRSCEDVVCAKARCCTLEPKLPEKNLPASVLSFSAPLR